MWVITGDSDHHPPSVNSRWPGGRVASHIYLVGKSTSQEPNFACAAAKDSISFAFHFAILCSGPRGPSGHRLFRDLQWTITCGDLSASNIPQKASAEEFASQR